jgi:hypothetical protein
MTEAEPDTAYSVFITERRGVFELRIRELFLVVRDPSLQKAYEELMRRKQVIIDSARAYGTLDEVPQAERPALFDEAPRGWFGRILSKVRRS